MRMEKSNRDGQSAPPQAWPYFLPGVLCPALPSPPRPPVSLSMQMPAEMYNPLSCGFKLLTPLLVKITHQCLH